MLNAIKDILQILNTPTLNNIIHGKIYPIVAPEETQNPFIVLKRSNYKVNYTNDSLQNNFNLEISIVSNSYIESVDIAQIIRNLLENYRNVNYKIRLNSVNESYAGAYIQELIFDIKN